MRKSTIWGGIAAGLAFAALSGSAALGAGGTLPAPAPAAYQCNALVNVVREGAYHTYGLHRQAGRNDIYFDGPLVRSYATHDGGALHHLVFSVGDPSGARAFSPAGALKVDYVRVWK